MEGRNPLVVLLASIILLAFGLAQGSPPPATFKGIGARDPVKPAFVWRGETGRSPTDVQRAGGMWARGFQLIDQLTPQQLEAGSSLLRHTNNPPGTREITQYVSTSTSLTSAMNFAVRPSPEHASEVGYLYRIRTNWAMVDVNLSLDNLSPFPLQQEQAAVQGIPWNQVLGWFQVRTTDLNRILGSDDPVSELGSFTRNADFRPDPTDPSGAQPQLAGLPGHPGSWENLRQFVRDHGPPTEAADQTTLRSFDWSTIQIPDNLRTALGQGAASAAQCAFAFAAVVVSRRRDELKRSVPWHQVARRDSTSNFSNECGRLAAVAKDATKHLQPTVKICDEPESRGKCSSINLPLESCIGVEGEWNDKASTILVSASAGICHFFEDYNCAGASFQSTFPGNDRLDVFDGGRFDKILSSIRCDNNVETQIERPPLPEVSYSAHPAATLASDGPRVYFLNTAGQLIEKAYYDGKWRESNLGGDIVGNPSATYTSSGSKVYARNTAGQLIEKAYYDGKWHESNLGGDIMSNPSAVSAQSGPAVYARNKAGQLIEKAYYDGSWHESNLGVDIVGDPSAFFTPSGSKVYARNTAGQLIEKFYSDGRWHERNLGGDIVGNPSAIFTSSGSKVYARNKAGQLIEKAYYDGSWHELNLGVDMLGDPSAVSTQSGHAVYARNKAGQLVEKFYSSGWHEQNLGGNIMGDPAAVYTSSGSKVYAFNMKGELMERAYYDGKWHPWLNLAA